MPPVEPKNIVQATGVAVVTVRLSEPVTLFAWAGSHRIGQAAVGATLWVYPDQAGRYRQVEYLGRAAWADACAIKGEGVPDGWCNN